MAADTLRIDKWLWFTRIVKKREWAQAMAASGHLRVDGRAVDRASAPVRVGQVLSFASHAGQVRAIRITALPPRRGSAAEAATCYQDLLSHAVASGSQEPPHR
ncbi:ribosome-associated heat shock protein Hsp15 [Sphingomonas jejuensis]|uniref:Ribosome-associated heat shock protein Hsp15 n=1 Tax=Sphingomonas jejuensis TaxID=904715 RepID=A0ABX0XLI9_9SPHN|nr:S4 domain-containing protein [Sphingomonas jejuensis]NJC34233.1 ribosome-associated heat shock protein Hsp15 [Sphingomonas jejuensis]